MQISEKITIITRSRKFSWHTIIKSNFKKIFKNLQPTKYINKGTAVYIKHFGCKHEPGKILTDEERTNLLINIRKTILLFPNINLFVKDIETDYSLIQVGRHRNLIDRFNSLFFPAILFHSNFIRATLRERDLRGVLLLSKSSDHTDNFQFIYVNGRCLQRCILHVIMNSILKYSLITKVFTHSIKKEKFYGIFFLKLNIRKDIFLLHYNFLKNKIVLSRHHYIVKTIVTKLVTILSDEQLLPSSLFLNYGRESLVNNILYNRKF